MIVNTKIGVDLLQLRQLLQIHTQQFFSLVILEQEQILWAVSKKKRSSRNCSYQRTLLLVKNINGMY